MTKKKNKISYVSKVMILFGLIAIFFICRNLAIIHNNVEIEATCYGYEHKGNIYKVSYFYTFNGKTYQITEEQKDKPKLSSKRKIYCSKNDTSRCILNKKKYLKGIYVSIIALIPVIAFLILDIKRVGIKNDTKEKFNN